MPVGRLTNCAYCVYCVYTVEEGATIVNIFIDNKSGVPIYDQVFSQIKSQIMNGTLTEDEALPSIRNLSKDLRISVITTKRAYDVLEREGFVYTIAGKGCFVAPKNLDLLREQNLKLIEEYLEKAIKLASASNLGKEDLIEMIELLEET